MVILLLVVLLHTNPSFMSESPKFWILWLSGFSSISASLTLVREWSAHTLWTFRPSLVLYFLGGYCGHSSANKREIGTQQMYQRAAWQACLVTRSAWAFTVLSNQTTWNNKKGFTECFHCVPGAVLSVYSSDYGRWSLPLHQSHGYHC